MLKKKICMVGQFGVGKTSLVRRFVESMFDERYHTTVGVKIDRKDVSVDGAEMTLMLWDLAGEDDLAPLNVSHLRGASGYILVVDGCRAASLIKAAELQKRIAAMLGPLPFVLVVNKADLREQWEVRGVEIEQYGWLTFETSAKAGTGVEEMFLALAAKLIRGANGLSRSAES
ncbi:MAG TPA: Rab family GTPase [Bryobacteraceae bacterium]|nr:Rab family GTPase [Bryobacteraceae bacterium]HUO29654.1 Rab family GTPase [Bryobacteraceae bacterium]